MENKLDRMENPINYSIEQIKDDRVVFCHNYNNEKYNRVILKFEVKKEENLRKIKDGLFMQQMENGVVWLDLQNKYKIPKKILKELPDAELIKQAAQNIYINEGRIIDIDKIKYSR